MKSKISFTPSMIVLVCVMSAYPNTGSSETLSQSNNKIGRYIAIPPPAGGEVSYGNFIWVLDTVTGSVIAHRIVNIQDTNGKIVGLMTERVITEDEYRSYKESQNK